MSKTVKRMVILAISMVIILITLYTLFIGFSLIIIKQSDASVSQWKNSENSIVAREVIKDENIVERKQLHNSSNFYVKWIANLSGAAQLILMLCLLLISMFCIWIISLYVEIMKTNFEKKLLKKLRLKYKR